MTKRFLTTLFCTLLMAGIGLAQDAPGLKPADNAPSLEVTMKFIKDKMNDQGTVSYVHANSGMKGVLYREHVAVSDVVADASTCVLQTKVEQTGEVDFDGKQVGGHDWVTMSIIPLKDVVSIVVESEQDAQNRALAEAAHPEVTVSYTPTVYFLLLKSTKKDAFSLHRVSSSGKQLPGTADSTEKYGEWVAKFKDEDVANRVAKAMLHAVELCGGDSQPEPYLKGKP